MGTTSDKLVYLNDTKIAIKDAIEAKGVTVGDIPFRDYAVKIGEISGANALNSPANFATSNVGETSMDLSWDAVTNADQYVLQRAEVSDYSDAVTIATQSTTSFDDAGLTADTTYYYRVKAQDTTAAYNDSTYSNLTQATTTASTSLLLDEYTGAKFGYSVRKIKGDYAGACMRVRRSSDNTEADIPFDSNGNLDETALLNYVGSGYGYVAIWYDQTGVSNAVQSTASIQPEIVKLGTIHKVNGKPAIDFGAVSQEFRLDITADLAGYLQLFSTQTIRNSDNSGNVILGTNEGGNWWWQIATDFAYTQAVKIDNFNNNIADGIQRLLTYYADDTKTGVRYNGVMQGEKGAPEAITTGNKGYYLGRWMGGTNHTVDGTMQEVIGYTDTTIDKAGIETNINGHFTIY